jgi:hypothetical protein
MSLRVATYIQKVVS